MASVSDGVAPRKHRLFVAAIDFGTTYSGYAFSSKDDWEKEPLKINANIWNSGTKSLLSTKAPTTLLLNPNKTFHSFGYEAETHYSDMADEEEDYKSYYYFHCFKMLLHNNKKLRRDTEITDATGKSLDAMTVFSISIKFLRDHLFNSLSDKFKDIQKDDIHFVLTVPAIWDDNAKQFMREAAVKAGISREQLSIALEPEVASIYCQYLPLERQKLKSGTSFLDVAKSGSRFMVVDLGGGTTDITLHERCKGGKLKEIHRASGGPWGGRDINEAFFSFLKELFGQDVIDKFKIDHMDDYLELEREFETKKRMITFEKPGRVKMTFPLSLFDLAKTARNANSVDEIIGQNAKYAGKVNVKQQKLQISNEVFKSLFHPTLDSIGSHIQKILKDKSGEVDNILMVGGFSECELVQNQLKNVLSNRKIIVPDDAGLAVLKGAVLFGHMPQVITSRVARHTYGIQSWPEFDPEKHPPSKRVVINGVARCKDVFFKYCTIGQEITPGFQCSQTFQALKPDEDTLECTIHASFEEDPRFVTDESCFRLGTLTVPLPKRRSNEPLEIEETMVFGETELHVRAKDITHNRTYEAFFNFLDN
ncbi:heat shock 70 kDa protein 12A-like [Saccostrea echinata]|uniref:heat shock 70 kDa protein 12A-like n=1 Tax=Saccostrea echinata TaxID=191078 RepID=UPI002A804AD0|nr:heat shock 70 kDa protein 12A-like [Saccostrea echinata]